MKVFLGDIVKSRKVLDKFSSVNFPARVAYRLKLLKSFIAPHLTVYEDTRVELVKKYGEQGEDNTITIPPNSENWFSFVKDMGEIAAELVDIPMTPFSLEELCSEDSVKLTVEDLELFDVYCKEEALES